MDEAINIVFICDDGYVLPTTVAITSIIHNKNKDTAININIIGKNLNKTNREIIDQIKAKNVIVNYIDVQDTLNLSVNNTHLLSNIPANSSALLKFNIPKLLPNIDKVLYLDGDIIVQNDLSVLYGWNISEVYGAAVKDIGIGIPKELAKLKGNYFNSGVMLLNLKKMREDNISEKLCKYRENGYNRFMDQDAFSWVFYGKTLFLPIKFNLLYSVYKYDTYETIADNYRVEGCKTKKELLNNATIVHLCSREKPWKYYVPTFSDLFKKYYALSPYKNNELILPDITYVHKASELKKLIVDYPSSIEQHKKTLKPFISIVIPVYNAHDYIQHCLGSIYAQKQENIELILVDNNSEDDSKKIIESYARSDKRISIFEEKKSGAGNARNLGLSKASAPYVLFLDADDLLADNILSFFVEFEAKVKSDIYVFGYKNFNNENMDYQEVHPFAFSDNEIKNYNGVKYATLAWTMAKNRFLKGTVAPWNKIYNTKYLKTLKASFDNFACTEDRSFYFHTIVNSKNISVIDFEIVYHRKNNVSSLTGDFRLKNFECNFKAHYSIMDKLSKLNDDSKAVLCELTISDIITAYYFAYGEYKRTIFKQIVKFFNECGFEKYENYLNGSYWYNKYKLFKSMEWILNESKNIVPIVFSVDNNYVPYLAVVIQSLKKVANENNIYFIAILNTDLSELNISRLEALSDDNFKVNCYNVKGYVNQKRFYSNSHYSIAMYYRLLIAEMFCYFSNVLYLDCDLIVKSDVSQLLSIDLGNNVIAAARNPVQYYNLKYVEYTLQVPSGKYFNSGVLVINTTNFLKEKIKDKCFELLTRFKNLKCPDQDLLNMACLGKVYYLPLTWNFQWHQGMEIKPELKLHEDEYDNYYAASKNYNILHFTSGNKPWIKPNLPLSYEFWSVARETLFYEEILYKNTLDKMQYILKQSNVNIVKTGLKEEKRSLVSKFFIELKTNGLKSALKKVKHKIFGKK